MRSSTQLAIFIFCAMLLSACDFKCSIGNTADNVPTKGKTVTSSTVKKDGTIITNNIELNSTGVKVKKATLLLENNSKVSDDNMVDLNQKIRLLILIDSGWAVKDGRSFIGASEKMTSSEGDVIVDAADLFADYSTDGIDEEDAKVISLNAVITQDSKDAHHYNVSFRIWDKAGTGEVSGSYKFYIKR